MGVTHFAFAKMQKCKKQKCTAKGENESQKEADA